MCKGFQYVLSFIPLIIGGLLYIAYRPLGLKMFDWFRLIGIEKLILELREVFSLYTPSDFFIYNLPYGLWSFSLSIILIMIWGFKLEKSLLLYLTISFCVVIGPELLQYFNTIPGTFDLIDILTNSVCFLSPIFVYLFRDNSSLNLTKV
jgi:hypothetical protein